MSQSISPHPSAPNQELPPQSAALDAFLEAGGGRGLILFALPDCDACVWFDQALAQARVPDVMGAVAVVEISEDSEDSQAVCARFRVAQFPTLVWCVDAEPYDAWAGFFGDPDPAVRLKALNAELASAAEAFERARA